MREELRAALLKVAALSKAVADAAGDLEASPEVEQVQVLANMADEEAMRLIPLLEG